MQNVAERIIAKLGGPEKTAEIADVDVSRVYRWTYPKERGGTGGTIPTKHQMNILVKAKALGIKIKPEDFFDLPKGRQ